MCEMCNWKFREEAMGRVPGRVQEDSSKFHQALTAYKVASMTLEEAKEQTRRDLADAYDAGHQNLEFDSTSFNATAILNNLYAELEVLRAAQSQDQPKAKTEGLSYPEALEILFPKVLDATVRAKRVTRELWPEQLNIWVRRVDVYLDKEFRVSELPGSEGTWMPFMVMKTPGNELHPWTPDEDDKQATDWKIL